MIIDELRANPQKIRVLEDYLEKLNSIDSNISQTYMGCCGLINKAFTRLRGAKNRAVLPVKTPSTVEQRYSNDKNIVISNTGFGTAYYSDGRIREINDLIEMKGYLVENEALVLKNVAKKKKKIVKAVIAELKKLNKIDTKKDLPVC